MKNFFNKHNNDDNAALGDEAFDVSDVKSADGEEPNDAPDILNMNFGELIKETPCTKEAPSEAEPIFEIKHNPYALMKVKQPKNLRTVFRGIRNWAFSQKPSLLAIRLIASYLLVMIFYLFSLSDYSFKTLDFVREMNLALVVGITLCLFAALSILAKITKSRKLDGWLLSVALFLYLAKTLYRYDNVLYSFGAVIVMGIALHFLISKGYFDGLFKMGKKLAALIIFTVAALVASYIIVGCIFRYLNYTTSCYDFGLFVQMYHSMITDLTVNTTSERNKLLSHFAIHFSPIYYLLFPFYFLFPYAQTLLIAQELVIMSGVIPLYLICRHFKLNNFVTVCFCFAFVFSPALIGPAYFDFHENAFLPPLILWILYSIETKKRVPLYICLALLLMVKEDAPVYAACIALYMILGRKEFKHGFIAFAISVAYFVVVTQLMRIYGNGVMSGRYSNFIPDSDGSLIDVIKTVILDPALVIFESFEEEKITFFITMLLPLAFMPFVSRKVSRFILLIPFILINLMSDYKYQHKIGYQYVLGTMPLLIFVSLINVRDMKPKAQKIISPIIAAASILMAVCLYSGKTLGYIDSNTNNQATIMYKNKIVSMIPDDASVEATTYFIPQLANRDTLYLAKEVSQVTWDKTDYVLLATKATDEEEWIVEKTEWLLNNGYELVAGRQDICMLYKLTDAE